MLQQSLLVLVQCFCPIIRSSNIIHKLLELRCIIIQATSQTRAPFVFQHCVTLLCKSPKRVDIYSILRARTAGRSRPKCAACQSLSWKRPEWSSRGWLTWQCRLRLPRLHPSTARTGAVTSEPLCVPHCSRCRDIAPSLPRMKTQQSYPQPHSTFSPKAL